MALYSDYSNMGTDTQQCPDEAHLLIQAAMNSRRYHAKLPSILLTACINLLHELNMTPIAYHDQKGPLSGFNCPDAWTHGLRCSHRDGNEKQCETIEFSCTYDKMLLGVYSILQSSMDLSIVSIDLQSELAKGLRLTCCPRHADRGLDHEIFERAIAMHHIVVAWRETCVEALRDAPIVAQLRKELEEARQEASEARQDADEAQQHWKDARAGLIEAEEQAERLQQEVQEVKREAQNLRKKFEKSDDEAAFLRDVVDDGRIYVNRARELASAQQNDWLELASQYQELWRELFGNMSRLFDAQNGGAQADDDALSFQTAPSS